MKSIFCVFMLFCIGALAEYTSDDPEGSWLRFKLNNNKLFLSGNKEKQRKANFLFHVKDMEEHNARAEAGEETYVKTIYPFNDLSREEFVARYTGANESEHVEGPRVKIHLRQSPPSAWDIRTNGPGKLTSVKNQGSCGSCWTFSTTATVENVLSIRTGVLTSLSEQQQVDCTYSRDGCQGGWFSSAYDHVKNTGLTTSSSYAYTGIYGTCKASSFANKVRISSYVNLANDVTTIKNALMKGACAACVDATYWSKYAGGVYSDSRASTTTCNHAVTLIGWGVDATTRLPFWTIRNSWGSSWGEQGHIRVAANGSGGIRTQYIYCPYM